MKTSDNGLNFIDQQEGEVDHVYTDVAGVATIGVGHALKPGETYPNGITHEQAMSLLGGDVQLAEFQVNLHSVAAGGGTLTQNQFDALVSFTFNCGGGALANSSLLQKLNARDFTGAAKAFLLWDKRMDPNQHHLVDDIGLLRRRALEAIMFMTPDGQ